MEQPKKKKLTSAEADAKIKAIDQDYNNRKQYTEKKMTDIDKAEEYRKKAQKLNK